MTVLEMGHIGKGVKKLKKQLTCIYGKHTKQCYEVLQKRMERDNFMSPEEAKCLGIIDHVLEHPPFSIMDSEDKLTSPKANEELEKPIKSDQRIV